MPRLVRLAPAIVAAAAFAFQSPQGSGIAGRAADPFATGWLLEDTNNDGIADFINGKIVVPAKPSAAENTAAANLAARAGFGVTGLTPPVVVNQDPGRGARIWVGKAAVPGAFSADVAQFELTAEEGGVFAIGGNLAVVGADDAGLQAAADAVSARSPYQWRAGGEKLAAIADELHAELVGVTYLRGKADVHRAFVRGEGITAEALGKALASPHLALVHSLQVLGGASATNAANEPNAPPVGGAGGAGAGATAAAGGDATAAGGAAAPARLDLATIYTTRGLFGAAGRIPAPASSNFKLYVPAGEAGIEMANLAARMGLETTGITLPIALPADWRRSVTFALMP